MRKLFKKNCSSQFWNFISFNALKQILRHIWNWAITHTISSTKATALVPDTRTILSCQHYLLLVNSLAIMHYWWLEKWGRFFTATVNFCWWCEVLSTEMRSFFGEPKVNQKNSSFQCEALHRTSKSWSGAVKNLTNFERNHE